MGRLNRQGWTWRREVAFYINMFRLCRYSHHYRLSACWPKARGRTVGVFGAYLLPARLTGVANRQRVTEAILWYNTFRTSSRIPIARKETAKPLFWRQAPCFVCSFVIESCLFIISCIGLTIKWNDVSDESGQNAQTEDWEPVNYLTKTLQPANCYISLTA